MNRSSALQYFCLAALLLPGIGQVSGQTATAEKEIAAIMGKRSVAGMSVAVVKNGRIAYAHSFGYKDLDTGVPLDDSCIFRIASISKSFSATSILQLVKAGKVSLDDDFGKLIGFRVRNPKFPETVITLKMVLSHTSSINDSQGYFNLDAINPEKGADWAKCYNAYEPGKGYQYCNMNFNMTGAVIERLSGERFDRYVKKHILDPLGIYGGYWVEALDRNRFATLYEYRADSAKLVASPMAYAPRTEEVRNYVMGYSTPIFSPTGGMKISATGLARYMIMHMGFGKSGRQRIIPKKSAKLMQTPVSIEEQYGLALLRTDKLIAGHTLVGHTGSAHGMYSAMFFDPKKKYGFVIITSGCNPVQKNGFTEVIWETANSLYRNIVENGVSSR